jgi:hypothetical protein
MFKRNENRLEVLDNSKTKQLCLWSIDTVSQTRRQTPLLLIQEAGLIISVRTYQEVMDPMRNAKPDLNVKAIHLAGCRCAWLNTPKNY